MIKVEIGPKHRSYPVYLQKGILESVGAMLARHHSACPVLLITDKNVSEHYAGICRQSLLREGFKPFTVVLEGGEGDKSLHSASRLYSFALEEGLDRSSVVMALGGGVIGDLAGFVAATYMRGIPFVQVPTTLLAMVDSSIGGKVAVNHPRGKNLIGAFYQPLMVLTDLDTLKSLPPREFSAGLAELVKYGIILDESLFEQFEHFAQRSAAQGESRGNIFLSLDNHRLLKLITKAVLLKGNIVTRDEKEEGLRRILNFGHTFGHALEQATSYEYYLHGEAVAVGMMAATRLAVSMDIIEVKTARRILNLLIKLNPPPPPRGLTLEAVAKALMADKKKEGDDLVFILPSKIGKTVICKSPPLKYVEGAMNDYFRQQRAVR